MGIFGSFRKANEVIEQARCDVAKGKGKSKDEVAEKRRQRGESR